MESMESSNAREQVDELGGYPQASKWLGIPITTLYSMVCQKRIPHIRLSGRMVRFRRSEIDKWLAANAVSIKAK